MVIYNIFGQSNGSYRHWDYSGGNRVGMILLGQVQGDWTASNVKELLSIARPGDVLQSETGNTNGHQHTMIIYATGNDTVTIYEDNWNPNTVSRTELTYAQLAARQTRSNGTKRGMLSLLRADNYETVTPPAPSAPTVTVDGEKLIVSWKDVAGETGYDVYLVQNPNRWEDIKYSAHVSADTTSYAFTNVASGAYKAFVISRPNDDQTQSEWTKFTKLTLTYDTNGGLIYDTLKQSSRYILSGSTIGSFPKTPVRSGYTFDGWYTAKSGGTKITTNTKITEDTTVYAHWIDPGNTFTITYDAASVSVKTGESSDMSFTFSGNGIHSLNLAIGDERICSAAFGTVSWNAYPQICSGSLVVNGLQDGTTSVTVELMDDKMNVLLSKGFSVTVSAKTYTISYDANDGSGAPAAQTKTHDSALTLSDVKPTKSGCTFQSWNTKADGSGKSYAPGASYTDNADLKLYAIWKQNETPVVAAGAKIIVSGATVLPGGEVTVSVSLQENPGIVALRFKVNYDSAKLTLIRCEEDGLSGWTANTDSGVMLWDNDKNVSANGPALKLVFRTAEKAAKGETQITVTDILASDMNEQRVSFTGVPGTITISDCTPGDVNGDGEVDIFDLVRLRKYLAGMDVTLNESATDVNADSEIDIFDLVRLRKYLAGMNVTLQ